MKRLFIILSILLITPSLFSYYPSYESKTTLAPFKSYRILLEADMFSTSAYFDSEGNRVEMSEGDSFTKTDGQVSLMYGQSRQLELGLGMRFRQNTSEQVIGTQTLSNSNSGLESYYGSLRYLFNPQKKLNYTFDLLFRQTAYTNKEYALNDSIPTDEIILGDSGSSYLIGMTLSYQRTKTHMLSGSAAYSSPGSNLSTEIPWKVESGWIWDRMGILIGLDGVKSMKSDEFSNNPTSKPRQPTGATAMFNGINREFMRYYGGINYSFEKWRMGVVAGKTMSGISTDEGMSVGLNVIWGNKGITREEEKREAFKEYNIEATVIKISPRGKFVQIDQGVSGDIEKGMRFDIYKTDFFGGNELVALGVAYEVGGDKSILKIVKKYQNLDIEKGFTARAR